MDEQEIEWRRQGACKGKTEFFFSVRDEETGKIIKWKTAEYTKIAKRLCNGDGTEEHPECPVKKECQPWAIVHLAHGYGGGLSERDRRNLRRRLKLQEPEPEFPVVTHASPRAVVLGTSALSG